MDDLGVSIPAKRDKTTAQRLSGACLSHTGPGANITSYFCCFSSPKTLIPGTQHKQAHPINYNSLLCRLPPTTTRPEFKNYQGLKSCLSTHSPSDTSSEWKIKTPQRETEAPSSWSPVPRSPLPHRPLVPTPLSSPSLLAQFWNPYIEHVLPAAGAA